MRSSHVTHRHPASVAGAAGVAHAFAYALTRPAAPRWRPPTSWPTCSARWPRSTPRPPSTWACCRAAPLLPDEAFGVLSEVPAFAAPPAEGRGFGVGGMTISLLLIAAYLFLHTGGDYLRAVEGAIGLGGDTDGTAVTAGALCAAWRGAGVVPRELADGVEEVERIRVLALLLHGRARGARAAAASASALAPLGRRAPALRPHQRRAPWCSASDGRWGTPDHQASGLPHRVVVQEAPEQPIAQRGLQRAAIGVADQVHLLQGSSARSWSR